MNFGHGHGSPLPQREREKTVQHAASKLRRPLQSGFVIMLSLLLASAPGVADEVRGNPAAQLLPGEFASEHWELTARFDSGHILFAEFLITNIGLGDRNAAATGYLVEPDGAIHRFRNGRREGHWRLSSDRLRIEIGASLLDLHSPAYRLRVDKRSVRVDLSFRPEGVAVWSQQFTPPGYALDLLAVTAPIEGTLWVQGMAQPVPAHGVVALAHSWMNEAGSDLVLRRIEFFSLQEDCSLYSVQVAAPDGTRTQWLVVKPKGRISVESQTLTFALEGKADGPSSQGYPVPGALRLKSAGVEGHVQLDRLLLRDDPFASLPWFFRFLVELTLNLRPRRVWALSPFEVSCQPGQSGPDHAPQPRRGTGVTAVTFLNPLPAS